MDLVDEEDGPGLLRQRLHHRLEPLLELAAELGPGEQGAEVKRVERRCLEDLGNLLLVDGDCEALGESGLSNAGLAHVDGIVLPAPAEHLHGALQLVLAPHQRIDPTFGCALDEIDAVGGKRVVGQPAVLVVALRLRMQLVVVSGVGPEPALVADLEGAVGDEPEQVEPRHPLLLEQIERVRIALAEERHQDGAGVDGFLSARLDLHRGPLQHALERARLLGVPIESVRQLPLAFLEMLLEVALELRQPGAAGAQDSRRNRVAQERVQQVLQRHVLVPPRLRLREGQPQGGLQLFGDRQTHSGSIVQRKGNSAAFAICSTVAALVSAIS